MQSPGHKHDSNIYLGRLSILDSCLPLWHRRRIETLQVKYRQYRVLMPATYQILPVLAEQKDSRRRRE